MAIIYLLFLSHSFLCCFEMNARVYITHTHLLFHDVHVYVCMCMCACVLVCRLSHILQHQIIFDLLGAQHTLHFQVITNIEELWNPKRRSSSITHPPYTSSSSVTRFMLSFCAAQTHTDNSNNNNEQALIIMI